MKFKVRIEGKTYDVQVGDLHTRPIIATVEGEQYEVWPEPPVSEEVTVSPTPHDVETPTPAPAAGTSSPRPSRRTSGEAAAPTSRVEQVVYAPIPGVIDSIAIQPGDVVATGQELCVLEAMKMKNVIRATRTGEIAAIHISPGQHVRHNDPLLEYAG
jgi:biotin carboxyl carrier protein